MGVKLGLCTNKPENTLAIIKTVRLNEFFQNFFIGSDIAWSANQIRSPLKHQVNKRPEEVFFVGDTNTDEEAAKMQMLILSL